MNLFKRIGAALLAIMFALSVPWPAQAAEEPLLGKQAEIEAYIERVVSKSDTPGMAVAIVQGSQTVWLKGYGKADIEAKRAVSQDTLFELGSTSKAFTGLGFLLLEKQGLLQRDDPVTRYLPWFHMTYKGKPAEITLGQLLHHTSGVPFDSIGRIPATEADDGLERTVRTLVGRELDHAPGEEYLYATINYDVLGLIMQTVTGQPYETFMRENVLLPLGLKHTYLFRGDAPAASSAAGYKFKLLRPVAYDAPAYRGNTPAGYYITSASDMARWLQIQLGRTPVPDPFGELIAASHEPDRSVPPGSDGSSYAAGWSIFQSGGGEISHGGSNPNFSSQLVLRPEEGLGVAVLANMNTPDTGILGQGIMNILVGKELPKPVDDMYEGLDNTASVALAMLTPVMLLTLWFGGKASVQAARGRRRFAGTPASAAMNVASLLVFVAGLGYCLYQIPDVIYWGLNWSFVRVWAPETLIYAIVALLATVLLFGFYYIVTSLYPKPDEKPLFMLTLLSIVSGLGNAVIIFTVNETLARDQEVFQDGLLLYFLLGMGLYIVGQRLVRLRLVRIANRMVYQKRTELLDKLLHTSYQNVEKLEEGAIEAALNNDTETISDVSNIIITGATSLVTLICCFVYMGIISFPGMLVAVAVIAFAAGMHFLMGSKANQLLEQTRDIQNRFFKFIHDLRTGFKELSLSRAKRGDFQADMQSSIGTYRDKRIESDLRFANVNVVGELLFTFVVGTVAFLFPLLFKDLQVGAWRNYVFVLLYMTGPVHGILGTIPNLFRVRVSWNRLNQLSSQLDAVQVDPLRPESRIAASGGVKVEMRSAAYHYANKEGEQFAVGPISYTFRSGEIVFITGGNGSGKSTLAKMLTGLYAPDQGEILVDGQAVSPQQLAQRFCAIFADFHLFGKLYGIPLDGKEKEIEAFLKLLHLEDKVQVQGGAFTTVKLSTGQRKRLALMQSYLEDRPIYLFDEWAADQDPEYRAFFYEHLLPELKAKGKCVIAITHDDRFFHLADRVIKMDMGQIAESSTPVYQPGLNAALR
ncbi:cyclic peptide export ABC transporter [Paenibacillus aurantiacus]|uniref:Cyclic peptide export ABC transporter n=1 Tax=Paenibacillus aurantiacus TaxID=1936118 RepID=A0ABV5KT28_9BACL